MLDRARVRAADEGLENVTFAHGDAQVDSFPAASFDVVISRLGAVFFAEPVAAFANIARAMRPDGRLALVAWQSVARNEWLTEMRGALDGGRGVPTPPAGVPGPFGWPIPTTCARSSPTTPSSSACGARPPPRFCGVARRH